ncbi:hypothetical protein A8713_03190 [Streptomyces sp. SAT1]|nr:hypothetical protein A8713_03190 [Streptomyces sp. SAT1]
MWRSSTRTFPEAGTTPMLRSGGRTAGSFPANATGRPPFMVAEPLNVSAERYARLPGVQVVVRVTGPLPPRVLVIGAGGS